MNIVKKIAITGAKVVGTITVGGTGVLVGILGEAGSKNAGKGVKESCDTIKNTCFDMVKIMWSEQDENSKKIEKDIKNICIAVDELKYEMKEYNDFKDKALRDPQKMKTLLINAGKNPELADNPIFMEEMRKKYGK